MKNNELRDKIGESIIKNHVYKIKNNMKSMILKDHI